MQTPFVFLRDDDIGFVDGIFIELFDFLIKNKIPVVYGVIPFRVQKGMVKILVQAKKNDPHLLDIAQHGFKHVNYAQKAAGKYEFGRKRSYAQQYKDIFHGLKIMKNAFGQYFTEVFIPPYHGFDQRTLKIVQAVKFRGFSAGRHIDLPGKSFLDLPGRFSLNYRPDGVQYESLCAAELVDRFRRAASRWRMVGVVYHHHMIKSASDMAAIKIFFRYLAMENKRKRIRIVLFSDLIGR